jgi:short-subunit dehydrogenase
MTQLQSATVLITGATGGFGQELTRQLLLKGSRLVLTDRPEANLETNLNPTPGPRQPSPDQDPGQIVACIDADLSTRGGCDALYDTLQQRGLSIDLVINNAGIALVGNMVDLPPAQWELLMQVNLLAVMRLSTRFAADMVKRGQGHIVNISSLAGWIAIPGLTAYAASKFGLRGFDEGLRHEVASYNVKVTTVYPSFSRTPILQSPRFGAFATENQPLPAVLTTDPARIMARTIRAIERNQAEVFPDALAWGGQWFKRYLPVLPDWVSRRQGMAGPPLHAPSLHDRHPS